MIIIFFIQIEAIAHNLGNISIKEALLIATVHPQINSRFTIE